MKIGNQEIESVVIHILKKHGPLNQMDLVRRVRDNIAIYGSQISTNGPRGLSARSYLLNQAKNEKPGINKVRSIVNSLVDNRSIQARSGDVTNEIFYSVTCP